MLIHGSSVTFGARGVLITGAPGTGKSSLALSLMAIGADLISDDRTILRRDDCDLWAEAPEAIRGQIEARGFGILNAHASGPARVVLAVDLDRTEDQRLPPMRHTEFLGLAVPLVLGANAPHLHVALRQYVLAGRHA
ncbi:serine kinase (plasmid) [Paracoccus sp. TK19116]|uniref:Serine kinase n=1 Tax=Paracoccus albicereus TaxID=2922394 RepID=A0ABT1MKI9_9RHOB|nr:serine kinase [Paracoccus albicereus]MCQ0968833.1 serine kinase [Paracoccus albicereus]